MPAGAHALAPPPTKRVPMLASLGAQRESTMPASAPEHRRSRFQEADAAPDAPFQRRRQLREPQEPGALPHPHIEVWT